MTEFVRKWIIRPCMAFFLAVATWTTLNVLFHLFSNQVPANELMPSLSLLLGMWCATILSFYMNRILKQADQDSEKGKAS